MLAVPPCFPGPADFQPNLCPPPTGAQCANALSHCAEDNAGGVCPPVSACDQYFADQARTDESAACNLLFDQSFKSEVTRYPTKTVLQTNLYSTGPFPKVPTAETVETRAIPDTTPFSVEGLDTFLVGERLRDANTLNLKGLDLPLANAKRLLIQTTRGGWEANGNQVLSCREYVHEKFYDYTVFEDAVLLQNNFTNHRGIVDLAYVSAGPNTPRTAIGTRHLSSSSIMQRDGIALSGASIAFDPALPKNDYYRVRRPEGSQVEILGVALDADGVPTQEDQVIVYPFTKKVRILLKNLKRKQVSFIGVALEDGDLRDRLAAGKTFKESFAWHRDMNLRNAPVLDEVMYRFDAQKEEFLKLLAQREAVMEQLAALMTDSDHMPSATRNTFAGQWYADPLWNPDPTSALANAKLGFDATQLNLALDLQQLQAPTAFVSYSQAVASKKPGPTPVQRLFAGAEVKAACGMNDGPKSPAGQKSPMICLAYQLEALDGLIEAELVKARTNGCFDTSTTAPAPCDWSPRLFSQRVMGQFSTEREASYRLCDESVDSFELAKARAFKFTGTKTSVDYPAADYTQSANFIDLYLTRLDEYLTAVGEVVGPLLERKVVDGKNQLRLRRDQGDYLKMGDDWFGARLDYQVGFKMEDVAAGDQCVIKTTADGHFTVEARIIKSKLELIHGELHASENNVSGALRILGSDWGSFNQPVPDGDVALYQDGDNAYDSFFEASAVFQIAFVTIRVGGSVGGGLGYTYQVQAGKMVKTGSPCTVTRIGVSGAIFPNTFVQAQAYAAIEAVIVRAGIKGYLNLVTVAVPFTGELSLGPGLSDPLIIDAAFELGAKIKLTFFSGRIVVFVEVGICPFCASAEADLVSWDGLQYEFPLFDYGLRVVLADLTRVAEKQGVLGETPP